MTERKKGTGRTSSSKSTGRKTNSSGKKVSNAQNRSRSSNGQAKSKAQGINSRVKDEIVAILIIAVGIFLAIAFQTSAAGAVGLALAEFFKGIFGFAAYILSYYFILYGVLLFGKKTIHVGIKSVVLLLIIFLMISLINSARFLDPNLLSESLGNISFHYNNGITLDGGGVFGMFAGGMLVRLIGIPGLYILTLVVIFVCLLLLMNTPVSRFLEEIKSRKQQKAEERQKYHEEKAAKRAEKQQRRAEQSRRQMEYDAHDYEQNTHAGNSRILNERERNSKAGISESQRNILNYISSESLKKDVDVAQEEVLDFSLGENSEIKDENKSNIHTEPKAEEISVSNESMKKIKEPVIIGGFSPKKMEEKISRAEAEKSTLREEELNIRTASSGSYSFPSVNLLNKNNKTRAGADDEQTLRAKALKLENTLHSFNIDAEVTNVTQGPAVTRYEVHPNSGVKVKGIKNLADDIALNMEAKSIRIEAPIPGKPAVGIEIENDRINMVTIREIIDSAAFKKAESKISFAVGKDIAGNAIVGDLKTMPHLLIAGSTGSGKSVCINSIITSILYKAAPDEVKLVLIDPKVVELANYNGIPHLLIPVVTEPSKAAAALNWAVAEMDERYKRFAEHGVRELASYNSLMKERGENELVMPQVVIIIDELADLMMAAPSQVEEAICRLAQKARAAGMHLIVATQRPSVDVITGVIKANIPSRIAFAVSSQFDSRTILDMQGAEKLVGKGDMLFHPLGNGKPTRVQGTFISDKEVHDVIEFIKSQVEEAEYSENVMDTIERANMAPAAKNDRDAEDELLPDAIELVVQAQQASVSMLQRRFRIGYNRAARIIDMMEDRKIVGPADGSRPRQVLLSEEEFAIINESTEDLDL